MTIEQIQSLQDRPEFRELLQGVDESCPHCVADSLKKLMETEGVSPIDLAAHLPSISSMTGSFRVAELEDVIRVSKSLAGICQNEGEIEAMESFESLSSEAQNLIDESTG